MPKDDGSLTEQEKMDLEKDAPDFVKEAEKDAKKQGTKKQQPEQAPEPEDKDEAVDISEFEEETKALTPKEKSQIGTIQTVMSAAMAKFLEQSSLIAQAAGNVSEGKAKRLIYFAVCKVEEALQKQGIKWTQVKQNALRNDIANIVLYGLDTQEDEAYAIPRKEGRTPTGADAYRVSVKPSAKGEKKLVLQHSVVPLKIIDAKTKRVGERFQIEYTDNGDHFTHYPDPLGAGEPEFYYAYYTTKEGYTKVRIFTLAKIEEYKKASIRVMKKLGPAWELWPEEMALVKCIRHLARELPKEFGDERLARIYEGFDEDEESGQEEFIDGSQKIPLKQQNGRYVIGDGKEA
ncbi:MAG: recombinase RecT [Phycisphaerae bacterium]|jgi:hypothetical protein